MGAIVDVTEI